MYKRRPKEETKQKFSCHIYIKNKLLSHASCYKKQNKRIKFKGVWEHYDSRHFIRPPPTLRGSIVLNDSKEKEIKREEEEGVEEEE